ncbi:hypothetical protein GCM10009092_33740 [Bowmanella denitrificans]|uniref:Methyltransferase domain-containing protein n=1 Tax=Bowmanella denitrificans TaxID=366582 RepID=A0ABN0XKN1_9ALTE
MTEYHHDLQAEAEAFNERISERTKAGFVPDLRRAQRCEYFYKSFWRDPKFMDLYVGEMYRNYSRMITAFAGSKKRILDVGCGPGYFALELAREGHEVTGIDIAATAIAEAERVAEENPYVEHFGSLNYDVCSIEDLSEEDKQFDVILFSGVLHHLEDINLALNKAKKLLSPNGIILGHEPCHEKWQDKDAAVVGVIRCLLAATGHWYEKIGDVLSDTSESAWPQLASDIKEEYVEERDKSEAGQSPHDNTFTGEAILSCVQKHFRLLEYKPSSSFIYRVLGGIRGDLHKEHQIAELLAAFDKYAVESQILNPNYFYFCARTV